MNVHELWSLRERGLSGVAVRCQQSNWWSKRNAPAKRRPIVATGVQDQAEQFISDSLISSDEAIAEWMCGQLPAIVRERPISLGRVNKVFASAWIDADRVLMGTKCNRLLVAHIDRIGSRRRRQPPPPSPIDGGATSSTRSPIVYQIPSLRSSEHSLWHASAAVAHSGMHAVRINRSQTRIATGGESPCDIAVYSLPELRPMTIGERAHSDWLFDLQWIDDQLAVSGSRDGSLAVWKFEERPDDAQPCSHVPWVHMLRNNNVSPGQTGAGVGAGAMWSYPTTRPIKTVRLGEHFDRVRTLVFSERNCSFTCASLSSHMCVIDAATMQRRGQTKVLDASQFSETVCMCHSSDERCVALGSRAHFTVFESDSLRPVMDVPLPESPLLAHFPGLAPTGVRSISWRGPIVTVGTGGGQLLFFDVRMCAFLQCAGHSCNEKMTLRVGNGWLQDDEMLDEVLSGGECPTAVYTHCYDASGTRLFAAGGPIAVSIQGNYAAVWQ